jgi:hypothetical protein
MKSLRSLLAIGGTEQGKYPSVLPFLEDISKVDRRKTFLVSIDLYVRKYSIKAEYVVETESWETVLDDECDAKLVVVLETGAIIYASRVEDGVFVVEKRDKASGIMSKLSRSGSALSGDSGSNKGGLQALNPDDNQVGLILHYSTLGEGVVWTPVVSRGGAYEIRMSAEGYEKAASVEGVLPLSGLTAYLKLSQYKLYTRFVQEVPDLARLPGIYTERYFCTELVELARNWSSVPSEDSRDKHQARTKFRTFPLTKEIQAMTSNDGRFSKETPNFTRKY